MLSAAIYDLDLRAWMTNHIYSLMLDMGVPELLCDASYDKVNKQRWDEAIGKIWEGKGIYLLGKAGVGKSYLAASILRWAVLNEFVILHRKEESFADAAKRYSSNFGFVDATALLYQIRSSFSTKGKEESEMEIVDRLCSYKILVLDDLGVSKPTDWSLQTIDLIVNFRYNTQKDRQTIITSNLTLDELSARYDDRIASRINGMCEILKCNGGDKRMKR